MLYFFSLHQHWVFSSGVSFSVNELLIDISIHRIHFFFYFVGTMEFLWHTNVECPRHTHYNSPTKMQPNGTEFYDCRLPAANSDLLKQFLLGVL